jgi:hypothetical protein
MQLYRQTQETMLQLNSYNEVLTAAGLGTRQRLTYAAAISPEECPTTPFGASPKLLSKSTKPSCTAVDKGWL